MELKDAMPLIYSIIVGAATYGIHDIWHDLFGHTDIVIHSGSIGLGLIAFLATALMTDRETAIGIGVVTAIAHSLHAILEISFLAMNEFTALVAGVATLVALLMEVT